MNKFFIVLTTLVSTIIYAQDSWDMAPQPPDLTSFSRYGTYDINHYQGSPNISIPLFTITEKEIEVPITLTYSSGGARVSDLPSWVGLGWNLYPGGSITRVVQGAEDSASSGYVSAHEENMYGALEQIQDLEFFDNLEAEYIHYDSPNNWRFLGEFIDPLNQGLYSHITECGHLSFPGPQNLGVSSVFLTGWAQQSHYFQPDIYIINFLNYTAKFYIHPVTKEYVFIDQNEHLIVEKDVEDWDIKENGWIITLPNGIKGYFQAIEKVAGGTFCGSGIPSITWKINKIELQEGELIVFDYDSITYKTATLTDFDVHGYVDQNDLDNNLTVNGLKYSIVDEEVWDQTDAKCEVNLQPGLVTNNLKVLNRIISPNYTVTFSRDSQKIKPLLKSVEIFDNRDADHVIGYEFESADFRKADPTWNFYRYGRNDEPISLSQVDEDVVAKYKLTSLQKYFKQGFVRTNSENPYNFEYEESIGLPGIISKAQDYWGYYNGQHDNEGLIPDESQMYANGGFFSEETLTPRNSKDDLRSRANANRGMSTQHLKQGQLTKITYPTKGYTIFDFEPHQFYMPSAINEYLLESDEIRGTAGNYNGHYFGDPKKISQGAGLRIREIRNYDFNGQFVDRKIYDYGQSGLLHQPLRFWNIKRRFKIVGVSNPYFPADPVGSSPYFYKIWSASGSNYSKLFLIPNEVGYGEVTESNSNTEFDEPDSQDNGQIHYQFHNTESLYNPEHGVVSLSYLDRRNGLVKNVEYKDTFGTTIKSKSTSYSRINRSVYLSMFCEIVSDIQSFDSNFKLTYMPIKGGWYKPARITEVIDGISTSTIFSYNNVNGRLNRSTIITSKEEELITTYFYADDSNPKADQSNLDFLSQNSIITVPLRTETTLDDELIAGTITNYERRLPIRTESVWQRNHDDSYTREAKLQYAGRDLVQVKDQAENNNWFYYENESAEQPIIKAVNKEGAFDFEQAIAPYTKASLRTLLAQLDDIATDDAQQELWQAFNQNLRDNAYNQTTMLYTYTYNPLIGVTSMTDAKGYTMYYVYDEQHRLKEVRDADGNLLKDYKYHLKGEE